MSVLAAVRLDAQDRRSLERVAKSHRVVHLHEVESLEEVLPDVEVLLCVGLCDFTPTMMERMSSLRLVQTLLAGADHLPLEIFRPGVVVCTTAGAGSRHVAEHAFALILAAAKNVVSHTLSLRDENFDRSPRNLVLKDATLGILGLGHVGRIVADMGRAFGMKVYAVNSTGRTREEVEFIGTLSHLDTLLRRSDYVVICLPLTRRTDGLIGEQELSIMKPGGVLVNVGRARVVQEEPLYERLKANPEFRAAFDVWWRYPAGGKGRPFKLPFHELKNFIMTPHVAGHVPSHRRELTRLAIENIGNYFMGRPLLNRVEGGDLPPQGDRVDEHPKSL